MMCSTINDELDGFEICDAEMALAIIICHTKGFDWCCTHVKTHKLLQVCKQKFGTSCITTCNKLDGIIRRLVTRLF
jgi:peptide subunit release factor RF-3